MEGIRPAEGCMIHCSKDSTKLVKLQDERSWSTLVNAAVIRCYEPILSLKEQHGESIPDISYHRSCRSLFTMKRDLLKVQQQSTTGWGQSQGITWLKIHTAIFAIWSGWGKVCPDILPRSCIFCSKVKYQRNSRTRENLLTAWSFEQTPLSSKQHWQERTIRSWRW